MSLILALSDLHFDVRMNEPFNLDFCRALTESWDTFRFDAVALAGDFCESEMLPVCGKLLREAVPDHVPILCVPGNHEFWGESFSDGSLSHKPAAFDVWRRRALSVGFTPLLNEVYNLDGWKVAGTPWWFYDALRDIEHGWVDYQKIEDSILYSHILADDSEKFLQHAGKDGKIDLVISHHVPKAGGIPRKFLSASNNRFYLHNVGEDVPARKWLFGHTHSSSHFKEGDTEYFCNPRGYGSENLHFTTRFFIDLTR